MNIPVGMNIMSWMMPLVLAVGFGAVSGLLVEILVGVAL
jgi:hypothetical protein